MAKTKNTPKISRKSAAAPIPERAMVPYTDDARDHRDLIIGSAIRAAINIIANDDNEARTSCVSHCGNSKTVGPLPT